jgi:hypothetical protein
MPPLPPLIAFLCALAAGACILLSTLFGVSDFSNQLLTAAISFLVMGIVIFTLYIWVGIIRDARSV